MLDDGCPTDMKNYFIICALACGIGLLAFWNHLCEKRSQIHAEIVGTEKVDTEKQLENLYAEWEAELERERLRSGMGFSHGDKNIIKLPWYMSLIFAQFGDIEWGKFISRKLRKHGDPYYEMKKYYLAHGVCKRFDWNEKELLDATLTADSIIPDFTLSTELVLARIEKSILQPQE